MHIFPNLKSSPRQHQFPQGSNVSLPKTLRRSRILLPKASNVRALHPWMRSQTSLTDQSLKNHRSLQQSLGEAVQVTSGSVNQMTWRREHTGRPSRSFASILRPITWKTIVRTTTVGNVIYATMILLEETDTAFCCIYGMLTSSERSFLMSTGSRLWTINDFHGVLYHF